MEQVEFEKKYLSRLNEQQKEAVRAVEGPILLLATPGSGKTTVLVTRLGYMIFCCGIKPQSILTMTYTLAATGDMRNRFAAFFGSEPASALQFRTINSVSKEIIDYTGRTLGRTQPGRSPFELQTDEGELNRMIRSIYQDVNESYPEDSEVKEIRRLITYIKNMMLSDEEIQKLETTVDKLPDIYRQYRDTLRRQRLMDYDDQMAYAYTILQRYPEVLLHFQEQYRYLCVDEAQDTSKIQHEIIRLLASKYNNLFMVGDEDQSIYGFRAAYPDALLNFEKDHPGAKVLLMEENYRSSEEIVAAANRFVSENRFRHKKSIIPTRGSGSPVHVVQAQSRATQYEYLIAMAKRCNVETAILFRNNDTALPLIDQLERDRIPYNCKKIDDLFFSHRIVVDILDIIRFSFEPLNEDLFMRLYYKFGSPISKKSAQYAAAKSKTSQKPIFEELMHAPDIRGPVQDAVIDLMQNLPLLQKDDAETAIHRIWEAMHYGRYVEQKKLDRGRYFILCMLAKGVDSPLALIEKLDDLRATIAGHRNNEANKIILSTIHSSKGLEYDTVYLADTIDGVLPSITASDVDTIDDSRLYEEERRLFYVGMTRAKNELYLFRCGEPSSFVSEITRFLPLPVVDPDDVFASLVCSKVGKQYRDQVFGKGRITAECGHQNLIAFSDGHCELMTISEMLSRRSTEVEYALPEEKPVFFAGMIPSPKGVEIELQVSQLYVGCRIRHKSFGVGKILALQSDVITVDFGQNGTKKLGLTMSIRNHIICPIP